jgi:hypothetical protein
LINGIVVVFSLLQKIVLKLNIHDYKDKQRALKAVSTLHGTDESALLSYSSPVP